MSIRVEFYGIPRSRAGVAETTVELDDKPARLGAVIRRLADRFPDLATDCFDDGKLRAGYAANVDGERFVSDQETILHGGNCLLIMSADAGG